MDSVKLSKVAHVDEQHALEDSLQVNRFQKCSAVCSGDTESEAQLGEAHPWRQISIVRSSWLPQLPQYFYWKSVSPQSANITLSCSFVWLLQSSVLNVVNSWFDNILLCCILNKLTNSWQKFHTEHSPDWPYRTHGQICYQSKITKQGSSIWPQPHWRRDGFHRQWVILKEL